MLCFSVVLALHLQKKLKRLVENILQNIIVILLGLFHYFIRPAQKLKSTKSSYEIVPLLVTEQMLAFFLRAHPGRFSDDKVDFNLHFLVVKDSIVYVPVYMCRPLHVFIDFTGKVSPCQGS